MLGVLPGNTVEHHHEARYLEWASTITGSSAPRPLWKIKKLTMFAYRVTEPVRHPNKLAEAQDWIGDTDDIELFGDSEARRLGASLRNDQPPIRKRRKCVGNTHSGLVSAKNSGYLGTTSVGVCRTMTLSSQVRAETTI